MIKTLLTAICLHWTVPDMPCDEILGYRVFIQTDNGLRFLTAVQDGTAYCEDIQPGECYLVDTFSTDYEASEKAGPVCVP